MKKYQVAAIAITLAILMHTVYADAQPPRTTVINRTTVTKSGNGKVQRTGTRTTVHKKTVKRTVAHTTPRGRVITRLPQKTVVIKHRNVPYYYSRCIYYHKRATGGYIVAPPPVGLHVRVLPVGFRRVVVGPTVFFHFGGTFYRQDNRSNDYEVVAPPQGGIIYDLPEDAQQMTVDGKLYYEYNGTLYKKVETDEGWVYEVAGGINDH